MSSRKLPVISTSGLVDKDNSEHVFFQKKPWGHERIIQFTNMQGEVVYVIKWIAVGPGHRFSLQHHDMKIETFIVQDGEAEMSYGPTVDDLTTVMLTAGDVFHIMPGTIHQVRAIGDQMFVFMEVSTSELDDVVRHADDYGRQGTTEA